MESVNCEMLTDHNSLTLTDLPYEVVEQILSYGEVSHADICRISEVCHKLYDIANSRRLWHTKFCQSWRSLCELYDNHEVDWKERYRQRYMYGKIVHQLIDTMVESASFPHPVDSSFSEFKVFANGNRFASPFMLDELEYILYDENRYSKLTTKFYCSKLLHFARQQHLKNTINDFLVQHENSHQSPDIGACLISQFFQPVQIVVFKDISEKLDDIALHVKAAVEQSCPKHSVLLKDLVPSTTVLRESLWPPSACRVILTCLNTIMFNNFEFECIFEDEGFSSDQILIDKVLEGKIGVPIMIAIIYAAVAHRLGVLCELCEPGNVALKWLEHPDLDQINKYTLIDITKRGRFFTPAEFSSTMEIHMYGETEFPAKLPSQVFKEVIKNLTHIGGRDLHHLEERLLYESSALELDLILCPDDKEKILMLVQLYLQMDARLFEVRNLLQRVPSGDLYLNYRVARLNAELECRLKPLSRQARNRKQPNAKLRVNCPAVSFAVGMIMRHKKYDYKCVIYGWDRLCRASNHWIQQMRVCELRKKSNQPFYNVLVEDGTQRYAAQENLEICHSPRFIEHSDVGKYFEEFQNDHFVPNELTRAEYPEDDIARETMLKEFFTLHKTNVDV